MSYFHDVANKHIREIHEQEELLSQKSKFISLRPYRGFYVHPVQQGTDGYYEIYDSQKRFVENCDYGSLDSTISTLEEMGA